MRRALFLLALASGAGCHRGGGSPLDEGQAALASAGLALEGWAPANAGELGATSCRAGRVEGLDAILCAYGGLDALLRGGHGAERWVGEAVTGATVTREVGEGAARTYLLLGVADRRKVDLSGRTIAKIQKAFAAR